jgi:CheY-like chemotaxis protein
MAMSEVSILLVDDNPTFRSLAARFLQSLPGVIVAGLANGGVDGLTKAQVLCPDLILVDLHMADLSGLKLIPLLRERLPRVGIIALTLLDAKVFRQVTLELGADEFVDKATMVTDLLPAIQRVSSRQTTGR